ncbi:AAA-like domain-containing protein [Candidatus Thiosymbion oneisti]|uniref:AAA-like domain-containing protein n=1 Tax=Candidatus Thiosymbion oneisti TaxID=589554 RepID=UPI000ACED962|nr:AAA-like domain-containing protein [Candidatus Thiosymbion oneisti]
MNKKPGRNFFQTGGTLGEDAPSYIERPADRNLATALAKNEICLVLAPRQTGKSSLMVHALAGLREGGARSAVVDLQSLGQQREFAPWLGDVVYQIENTLGLDTDTSGWWKAHEALGPDQRFMRFLEEVVLAETGEAPVVVFFDEIDSVLPLPFADDFFTTLRALYNVRAVKPLLKRLSFVLLGVADAADFISDSRRTPFNIGTAISLQDFDPADTGPFREVLGDKSADLIERIFHWSGGQPFMVQSLAEAVWELPPEQRDTEAVDAIVRRTYPDGKIEQDTHFRFIQDYLLAYPKLRRLLGLYRRILQGKPVAIDEQDPLQNRLRLAGVVRVEKGRLQPRNRIYRSIFDLDWIKRHFPSHRQRLALYGMTGLMVVWLGWQFLAQPLLFPRFPPLTSIVRYTAEPVVEIPIDLNSTNVSQVRLGDQILFEAAGLPVLFQQENLRHQLASLPVGKQDLKLELSGGLPRQIREIPLRLAHYPGWEIKQIPDKRLEALNPILDIEEQRILFKDVMNGRVLGELAGFEQPITALRLSADRRRLLVGTQTGQINLWEINLIEPGSGRLPSIAGRRVETKRLQSFNGHPEAVLALDFSLDGNTVLSAGRDRVLRLWDVESGKELRRFEGHEGAVSALLVAGPRSFFSAAEDGTVRRWDMLTGKAIAKAELPDFDAATPQGTERSLTTTLDLSPQGKTLLAAGVHGISLWDLDAPDDGKISRFARFLASLEMTVRSTCRPDRREGSSRCAKISPFARNDKDGCSGTPKQNDPATPEQNDSVTPKQNDPVTPKQNDSVTPKQNDPATPKQNDPVTPKQNDSVTPKQNDPVTLKQNDSVTPKQNDPVTPKRSEGSCASLFTSYPHGKHALFTPDGQGIVSGGPDGTVTRYNLADGQAVRSYTGLSTAIRSLAFGAQGQLLLARGLDNGLKIWERTSGEEIPVYVGHSGPIIGVDFSPDGHLIATAGGAPDSSLRVWEADSGRLKTVCEYHAGAVWAPQFTSDSRQVITSEANDNKDKDMLIRFCDVTTGETVRSWPAHDEYIWDLDLLSDGKLLASASGDKTVKLWDVVSGEELAKLEGHTKWVNGVAFSPDGKLLASTGGDGSLRLWEVTSGWALRTLFEGENRTASVAFSPDGKNIIAAVDDRTLKLFDVATGQLLRTLRGHEDLFAIGSVTFSPDGKQIASANADDTVKLWDAAGGTILRNYTGHKADARALAFSPDGDRLVSVSEDGTLKIWWAAVE